MPLEMEPVELVDRVADERLLNEDAANLPAEVGRPEAIPPSATRARLVGVGATLTAVTLIVGIGLIAVGVIGAISSAHAALDILAIGLGALLAGTHWGWVHVAEASADALESRRNAPIVARRRQWLQMIEPYTRYEIQAGVTADGSITLDKVDYVPRARAERSFTFERRTHRIAVYSGDDDAAAVASRAEHLRQQAAAETDRERQRFEIAAASRDRAILGREDHQQQVAVRRAAAQALSEQINSHLRNPPLG
jgi:hypothetical protein